MLVTRLSRKSEESSLRSQTMCILILSTHPVPDLLNHQIPFTLATLQLYAFFNSSTRSNMFINFTTLTLFMKRTNCYALHYVVFSKHHLLSVRSKHIRQHPVLTHIYLPTPWSRVLLEKLTGFQIVTRFPAFYGTRKFITASTSARHLSLS